MHQPEAPANVIDSGDHIVKPELKISELLGREGIGFASFSKKNLERGIHVARAFVAEMPDRAAPERGQAVDTRRVPMTQPAIETVKWVADLECFQALAAFRVKAHAQISRPRFRDIPRSFEREIRVAGLGTAGGTLEEE